MAKIYAQDFETVWTTNTTLTAAGSTTSGSFITLGYARLVGLLIASASAKGASGLRVYQSSNWGTHWDYWTDYAPTACSGSGFSIEMIGNAAKIEYRTDSAASLRTSWRLRPI